MPSRACGTAFFFSDLISTRAQRPCICGLKRFLFNTLTMTKKALFVRLEAKPGKENEVAEFLRSGQPLVQEEPDTTAWFGIQLGPGTFAIFDAFEDDAGRDAHLSGKVAAALMGKAADLFAEPPKIEKADVLADKL